MVHEGKKMPRLWLLGHSLIPKDARGSNHSFRTKQQIFLHFCSRGCQNLLWSAKAGREGGLDGSHLLPKEDNAELPSLWPFLCRVNYFCVFLSPLTHLWALTAIFPQLWVTPRGKPAQKPAHFYSAFFTICLLSPEWFLGCLHGWKRQLILTWTQLILTIGCGQN